VLAENRARLGELTAQPRRRSPRWSVPVEELSYRLSRVWSPIGHLNAVANSAEMREAYNECVPLLTAYSSELGQNAALYAGYAYVLQHEGDASIRRSASWSRMRCAISGSPASICRPDRKARYREVMQRLAQLATKFSENVLDAARAYTRSVTDEAELAGLPANAVDRAAADAREAGQPGWLFKLDQPTYMTVMTSAQSEQLRRDIYEAWVTRASELGPSAGPLRQQPLIAEILPLRHELAQLLGFKNFADYALATRMAKSSKQVLGFLDDLARRCLPAARQEFSDLEEFAGRKLEAWDLAFYSERLQESRFKVSQEALRPYFPLPKVLGGFVRADRAPVRHHRARTARRQRLASERALLRPARLARMEASPASISIPIRAARSAAARGWTNASRQVAALRHGAARGAAGVQLHGAGRRRALAADARRSHHAVPRVRPWLAPHADARGLPQHRRHQRRVLGCGGAAQPVHGEFRLAAEVLPLISAHVTTGEPLPVDMLQRLLGTRTFNAALDTLRQIELASFDFELHANFDPAAGAKGRRDSRRGAAAGGGRAGGAVQPHAASFAHIFAGGYAAGYYSYKWAEVLAADAFEAFEEAGVFDSATATRFAIRFWRAAAAWMRWTPSCAFAAASPTCGRCSSRTGIAA
jgi:oligopeptidase A